jgi:hypothetical protein
MPTLSLPVDISVGAAGIARVRVTKWTVAVFEHPWATRAHPRPEKEVSLIATGRIYRYTMTKTVRLSDDFHSWVKAHNQEDETMEETLRRLTRGPHPSELAGLLTDEEAAEAKERVEKLREGDADRLQRAREAFESE